MLGCDWQSAVFPPHWRGEWSATRQRRAEIRKAITAPGKPLGVNVPVFPSGLAARFRMINDPVLGLAQRLHERTMPNAPDLIRLLEHWPVFGPRSRIEHLVRFVMQQSEAIIRRPASARGINDK